MTLTRRQMSLPRPAPGEDPMVYMGRLQQLVQDEFNRLADDFARFKSDVEQSGSIALNAVTQLTATPTQFGVTATWELPGAQPIPPTEVHVRIVGVTPWAQYTYPLSTWTYSGLAPGTQYTIEVKVVARYETNASYSDPFRTCPVVPVLRTAESNAQPRTFTTLAGVSPPGDGGTTNIDFTFPDTDGTAGPVGGTDCWWEYGFQSLDDVLAPDFTVSWTDVGSLTEVAGNIGNVTVDTSANPPFVPGTLYRMKYREVCNSVPGDWIYGPAFPIVDWTVPCAGVEDNSFLSGAPYTSADLWAIPGACQVDGDFLYPTDALTDTKLTPIEEGLGAFFYGSSSDWVLIGNAGASKAAVAGNVTAIGNMNDNTGFTFSFDAYLTQLNLSGQGAQGLLTIADIISVTATQYVDSSIYATGDGAQITVTIPTDGGGSIVATTPDLIPEDAWTQVFVVVHAGNGTSLDLSSITIYVDGTEVTTVTKQATLNFFGASDFIQVNLFDNLVLKKFCGWNRELASSEIPVPSPLEDSLPIHLFRNNEGSGTTTTDYGSLGLDGTKGGGGILTTRVGEDGQSYIDFQQTGSQDGVSVAHNAAQQLGTSGTLTFMILWYRDSTVSGYKPLVSKTAVALANEDWSIRFRNQASANLLVEFRNTSGSIKSSKGFTLPYTANDWGLAFVEIGNTGVGNAYGEDNVAATVTSTGGVGGTTRDSTNPMRYGSNFYSSSGTYLDSAMAHLAVWDRALTSTERADIIAELEADGWFA